MVKKLGILRFLIRELLSPVGASEAEVISNIDEVIAALNRVASDKSCKISDRIVILDCIKTLGNSTSSDGRKMSAAISSVIDVLENTDNDDAKSLILRLQTILRRDLPVSGIYDPPQGGLNAPFDPSKSTKFGPTP